MNILDERVEPYIMLDSDYLFAEWLGSLDVLFIHPTGMPTAAAVQLTHANLIPNLEDHRTDLHWVER